MGGEYMCCEFKGCEKWRRGLKKSEDDANEYFEAPWPVQVSPGLCGKQEFKTAEFGCIDVEEKRSVECKPIVIGSSYTCKLEVDNENQAYKIGYYRVWTSCETGCVPSLCNQFASIIENEDLPECVLTWY